jgi:uncharacterized protein DUF1996
MNHQRFLIALAFLAVATGLVAAQALGDSSPPPKRQLAPRATRLLGMVNFTSGCRFSHRAPDDPIVLFGYPGTSHDHSFVGNTTTNAFSTLATLKGGSTTCRRPADKAGYWMPTLLDNGTPVAPIGATVYYRRRTLQEVKPFPQGLKVVAGDSKAASPQSLAITYWNCGPTAGVRPQSAVPTCPDGLLSALRLHVRFPECWDGTNLDSPDHKSHMAYAVQGACPADHPVAVPALEVIFRYPIKGDAGVTLSSGGQFSGHADFFNAWDEQALARLTDFCLNGLRHCQAGPWRQTKRSPAAHASPPGSTPRVRARAARARTSRSRRGGPAAR